MNLYFWLFMLGVGVGCLTWRVLASSAWSEGVFSKRIRRLRS